MSSYKPAILTFSIDSKTYKVEPEERYYLVSESTGPVIAVLEPWDEWEIVSGYLPPHVLKFIDDGIDSDGKNNFNTV